MRSSRCIPSAGLAAAGVLLLAAAGCASSTTRIHDRDRISAMLDSLAGPAVAGTPRVRISTEDDAGRSNRVFTRLHVDETAYVAVVNVSPGGYATVMFPEQPDEPAVLLGGKSYVIPSYFTGYHWAAVPPAGALGTRLVWYGRSSNARPSAQGAGYIFVIASRSPLNLEALALEGYFDGIEVGTSLAELAPETVVPKVALVALAGTRGGASVDYARYSGYDPMAYVASAMRSSYNTSYCGAGYDLFDTYGMGALNQWDLGAVRGGCDPLEMWRSGRGFRLLQVPGVPTSPPVNPVPPDSGSPTPPAPRPSARPKPQAPPPADTLGLTMSAGERRIVNSSVARPRTIRPEPLATERDDVVLTHAERQRAVRNARARIRPGVAGDGPQPYTRPRAPRAAERPETTERDRTTTGSSGAATSEPVRSSPPPTQGSVGASPPPMTRGTGAPKPEPTKP